MDEVLPSCGQMSTGSRDWGSRFLDLIHATIRPDFQVRRISRQQDTSATASLPTTRTRCSGEYRQWDVAPQIPKCELDPAQSTTDPFELRLRLLRASLHARSRSVGLRFAAACSTGGAHRKRVFAAPSTSVVHLILLLVRSKLSLVSILRKEPCCHRREVPLVRERDCLRVPRQVDDSPLAIPVL
jgi:hypothetical protein